MEYDKSLLSSFRYALAGVWHALKNNRNLRIDFLAALLVIILSIIFHTNPYEKGVLGVTILLVICSEMINTSLEEMVNLITSEHKKEAKIAKDVAAAGAAYSASQAAARGLAGTILTSGQGTGQGTSYASKTLTGQ